MSTLPAAFEEPVPARRRLGRATLARGLAASLSATLLIASAFAILIQAAGAAPAGDPAARTERAQQLVESVAGQP